MLSFIGGLFFIIAVIGIIIFLPIMIVIFKTVIALKNNKATKDINDFSQSAKKRDYSTTYDDVIETTCTVIKD